MVMVSCKKEGLIFLIITFYLKTYSKDSKDFLQGKNDKDCMYVCIYATWDSLCKGKQEKGRNDVDIIYLLHPSSA